MVSLGAVKVVSNPRIASIAPEYRKCYFEHEHPPDQPLTAHQKYSQVILCSLDLVYYLTPSSYSKTKLKSEPSAWL